jgi:hypothetical protein
LKQFRNHINTTIRMARILTMILILTLFSCKVIPVSTSINNELKSPIVLNQESYIEKKTVLTYIAKIREPEFKNLNMLGEVKRGGVYGQRMYGMILRSLRFKNITDKIEKKYNLPENLLLAMIMHESGGVDLLPNSSDDGGVGLIHMQANMARKFGLSTYKNCDKLVCKEHGEELRQLIKDNNYDRKKLIMEDERFHPILNIDAAARMLMYYMSGNQTQDTPLKTAIYGYAGKYNYQKYYDNIVLYMQKLADKEFIQGLENDFNEQNKALTLNGKPCDFWQYINAHQEQNMNYGLNEYN